MVLSEILLLVKKDIKNVIPEILNAKLKITSFDICGTYIVLGSNSGTLFFFNSENYSLIQRVRTKNGRIIQISIHPDKAYLAYASTSGLVFVLQVPGLTPQSTLHPVSSRKHEGSTVTSLAWSHFGRDLYIGDSEGIFSLLHVPLNLASSFILNLSHYLMKLDSAIFQLDVNHHYILISTLTKSYICNTRLETYSGIGTKSRQGEYGGCICKITNLPSNENLVENKLVNFTSNQEPNQKTMSSSQLIDDSIENAVEAILDFYTENKTDNCTNRVKYNGYNIDNDMDRNGYTGHTTDNDPGKTRYNGYNTDDDSSRAKCNGYNRDNDTGRGRYNGYNTDNDTSRSRYTGYNTDNGTSRKHVYSLSEKIQKFVKEEIYDNGDNNHYFNSEKYRVFCSRPGLRLWESDFKGSVIATHQLKNAIPNRQAPLIILGNCSNLQTNDGVDVFVTDKLFITSLSFKKILNFYDEYLVANSASAFYVIDPSSSKIIIWCPVYEGIQDIKIHGNCLLVFTLNSNVHKFQITTVDIAISTLHSNGYMMQCAALCLRYSFIFETSYLLKHCWQRILNDIITHVNDKEVVAGIIDLKNCINTPIYPKLNHNHTNQFEIRRHSPFKSRLLNGVIVPVSSYNNTRVLDKEVIFPNKLNRNSNTNLNLRIIEKENISNSLTSGCTSENNRSVFNNVQKDALQGKVKSLAVDIVSNITTSSQAILDSLSYSLPLQKTGQLLLNSLDEFVVNKSERRNSLESILENHLEKKANDSKRTLKEAFKKFNGQLKCDDKLRKYFRNDNDFKFTYLNEKSEENKPLLNLILPDYLKSFYNTVLSIKIILKYFNKSRSVTNALLILFLKEYEETNHNIGSEDLKYLEKTSLYIPTERKEFCKEITLLIVCCLQEGIFLNSCVSSSDTDNVMVHSLTPKSATDIDIFYARLIFSDCGLIDCSIILNKFHLIEKHLMFHTWLSLMKKGTKAADGVHKMKALPEIEFTRSQRIQYLRIILESNGWDSFLSAISRIQKSTVLFDIYYFVSYFSKVGEPVNLYDSMKKYFDNMPCDRIGDLFTKYWSKCPEIQADVIISLMRDYNQEEFTCQCKYPLPNSMCQNSSSISLVIAMTSLPLYFPHQLYNVFQRKYFYAGIFDIAIRYNITPYHQLLPFVLQSFHKVSIIRLLDRLTPSQFPELLLIVSGLTGVDDTSISCLNCSKQLPICFDFHKIKDTHSSQGVNTKNQRVYTEEISLELKSFSSLWQLIYIKMVERFGNAGCLQILQEMVQDLPQPTFLKKLFIQSILVSMAEVNKSRLQVPKLASVPRYQFAISVRNKLDDVLLSKADLDGTSVVYHCRESKNLNKKVYIDSDTSFSNLRDCVPMTRNSTHAHLGSSPPITNPNGFCFTNGEPKRSTHHWGVKTQIINGVCQLCQLGLTVDAMVNAGGLTVFACGHAYHTICLMQYGRFCVLCHRPKVIV